MYTIHGSNPAPGWAWAGARSPWGPRGRPPAPGVITITIIVFIILYVYC